MSITLSEHLLTLNHAARTLPGGGVHVSTIHRWRLRGVRGVRLETLMRGGVRYTSTEALERFFGAITVSAGGELPNLLTSRQEDRRYRRAKAELDAELYG